MNANESKLLSEINTSVSFLTLLVFAQLVGAILGAIVSLVVFLSRMAS